MNFFNSLHDRSDLNFGCYGADRINSGKGDDYFTENGGTDKFKCGQGEDTITDFNEVEETSGNRENIPS